MTSRRPAEHASQPEEHEHPQWGPPRFGVGALLLVMTIASLLLASYTWFGALGAIIVGFFALAVLGHVVGNWLGNELRDFGSRTAPGGSESQQDRPVGPQVQSHHFAPTTSLRQHRNASRRLRITLLVVVVAGTAGGAVVLHMITGQRATWVVSLSGGLALGILGALATFIFASFIKAGWDALQEATKH